MKLANSCVVVRSEFINNYFTLFFIAFLIHIDIPFHSLWTGISQEMGLQFPDQMTQPASIVSVLQQQLFVVFTGVWPWP